MRILLDTHALIWFASGDARLAAHSRTEIENPNNERFLSIVSAWEIAIKDGLGKLQLSQPLSDLLAQANSAGVHVLGVKAEHVLKLYELPPQPRDPFDRLIAGQALVEDLTVLSIDTAFDTLGATRLWK